MNKVSSICAERCRLWGIGVGGGGGVGEETFKNKKVWYAYPCEGCPQRDHQVPGIEEGCS